MGDCPQAASGSAYEPLSLIYIASSSLRHLTHHRKRMIGKLIEPAMLLLTLLHPSLLNESSLFSNPAAARYTHPFLGAGAFLIFPLRSEERRVGKDGRARWSPGR